MSVYILAIHHGLFRQKPLKLWCHFRALELFPRTFIHCYNIQHTRNVINQSIQTLSAFKLPARVCLNLPLPLFKGHWSITIPERKSCASVHASSWHRFPHCRTSAQLSTAAYVIQFSSRLDFTQKRAWSVLFNLESSLRELWPSLRLATIYHIQDVLQQAPIPNSAKKKGKSVCTISREEVNLWQFVLELLGESNKTNKIDIAIPIPDISSSII